MTAAALQIDANFLEPWAWRYCKNLTTNYPSIKELWLFGSRARGTATPISDYDIIARRGADVFLDLIDAEHMIANRKIDLFVELTSGLYVQPWRVPGVDGLYRRRLQGEFRPGTFPQFVPTTGKSSPALLIFSR